MIIVENHGVEKSEAFNSFKCFKTMVEKETRLFLKVFRTDGGEDSIKLSLMIFANK